MACPGLRPADPARAVSVEHVRASELNTVYLGTPLLLLMENAGRSVADLIECKLGSVRGKTVHILAGKGGNGGDGIVAARHLARRGARVVVHLSGRPEEVRHPDARLNLEALMRQGDVRVVAPGKRGWLELDDADAVVDALLGIGVRGSLRGIVREMVDAFNRAPGLRVAVDTPTGVNPDTGEAVEGAARADVTVTMGWEKRGLLTGEAPLYIGELLVAEIGAPEAAERLAGPGDVVARIPERPPDAHKGVGGRVLVVGGGRSYIGAPMLSAFAAAMSGVDLVVLASRRWIAERAAVECSSLLPHPFQGESLTVEDIPSFLAAAGRAHAVLIGPGLGAEEETLEATARLIEALAREHPEKPLVLDADALKALAEHRPELPGNTVLTPHRGEAARLAGEQGDPERLARLVAERYGATVLLKGPTDTICTREGKCRLNRTGVPAMSVGGTGDILAGVTAAFLARRASKGLPPDPLNTAAAAAFLTGLAGELAYRELGESMTAYEVLERLPQAFREARRLAGLE